MEEFLGIKETCLYINDLDVALEFYHKTLGLQVIHYDPGRHLFLRAGRSVLLCFNPADSRKKESPPPHFATGNQHYAFEVNASDYAAVKGKIQESGITIIDEVTWRNGQQSFYFLDPEENVLEIVPEGIWE